MNRFKKFSLAILFIPLVVFGIAFAVNAYLDPDNILSPGKGAPFLSTGEKRYKIAGVINNYDVGNILVGGSLMNNVVPSEVESALGWDKVFSLSFPGGDLASISKMAQYAIGKHKISNVLFSLQPLRMADTPADTEGDRRSLSNYLYLYDDNRLNDLMVFAQMPTYYVENFQADKKQRKKLRKAFPGISDKDLFTASKDMYSHYMSLYREFNRPLFISSLETTKTEPLQLAAQFKQNLRDNLERHVLPLVKDNPKTGFYFLIGPETFLAYKRKRNILVYAIRFLVKELSKYPNVKLYGFTNAPFNADLRLYKDLSHSHIEVSRYVLSSVARNEHRLTAKNIDAYVRELKNILDTYEVHALWRADYYERGNGPYPKRGYITYHDAARLIWGKRFNDKLYNSIPRSPYLAEESYAEVEIETNPPLNADRKQLEGMANLKPVKAK